MEDFVARTFNGASPMQIGIALVITLALVWVFWVGARSSNRPPRDDAPGETS